MVVEGEIGGTEDPTGADLATDLIPPDGRDCSIEISLHPSIVEAGRADPDCLPRGASGDIRPHRGAFEEGLAARTAVCAMAIERITGKDRESVHKRVACAISGRASKACEKVNGPQAHQPVLGGGGEAWPEPVRDC